MENEENNIILNELEALYEDERASTALLKKMSCELSEIWYGEAANLLTVALNKISEEFENIDKKLMSKI